MSRNAHEELRFSVPSAYRMAKDTGIPFGTCKRWWRNGKIPDAGLWLTVWQSATDYDYSRTFEETAVNLAGDYND